MALLDESDWRCAQAIAGIATCNPFLPERMELERAALGGRFVEGPRFKQRRPGLTMEQMFPNLRPLAARGVELLGALRQQLSGGAVASEQELETYEDLALVTLYFRYGSRLGGLLNAEMLSDGGCGKIQLWGDFCRDYRHTFEVPNCRLPSQHDPAHTLAGFYQVERAYFYIFQYIAGGSLAAGTLRASVWQSIFTHDMRRYGRVLYRHMDDIPSLIIGPSGSGKELVARAIGLSRYIPFDAKSQQFATGLPESFHAVNVAALAPTLIESELFGHRKGAFTGALTDRDGWLERGRQGAVFLDEIGEIQPAIQVKLLRVLQERKFQRLGESKDRDFCGKLIAATNRDLGRAMHEGGFREDLYYRLCADVVHTPSLHEQLADEPGDLVNLVRFAVARTFEADESEQEQLAGEVASWIDQHLGSEYTWPGNFRELEQCVRNVIVRRDYRPINRSFPSSATALAEAIQAGELTSDQLLTQYYKIVYQRSGSYRAAARQLEVDWRTVKDRVNADQSKSRNRDTERDRAHQRDED